MENTTNEKNTNKNTEEEIIMKNAEVDSRSKSVYYLYKAILNHFSLAPYYMSLTPENNLEDQTFHNLNGQGNLRQEVEYLLLLLDSLMDEMDIDLGLAGGGDAMK